MALLDALRTPFLLRRLLVELRGIRRALERTADVQELLAQQAPRTGGQSFRGFSRLRPDDGQVRQTSVSYVDPAWLEQALLEEAKLRNLLGRDPTDEELERAIRGDVE